MIPKESAWGYREDVTQRVRGASGIVQLRLPAFDLDLMGRLEGGRAAVDYTIASRVLVDWETPQPGEVYFPVWSSMEMHAGSGPAATHFRRRVAPYGDVTHVAAARSRAWLELTTIVVPGLTVPIRSAIVEVDVSPGRPSPFVWSEPIDGNREADWVFHQYPGAGAHEIPPFVRELNVMPNVLDAGFDGSWWYSDAYQIPGHVIFGRTPDGAYVVKAQPFGPAAGASSNFTMFDLDSPLAGQERHWIPIPTDARTVQVRLPIPTEIGMPESVLVFWRGYR